MLYIFEIPSTYVYGIGDKCFWCGIKTIYLKSSYRQPPTRATRDHLITRKFREKGTHSPIVLSCRSCNSQRGISMNWLPENPTEIAERFVKAFNSNEQFVISWCRKKEVTQEYLVIN